MIAVGTWGVRLEAILEPLTIVPGHTQTDPTASTADGSDAVKYELKPRSAEQSEILILRHGDTIHFARSVPSLICKWIASEIQVNSSAAETRATRLPISDINAEASEEDTEDEDLDEATEVSMAIHRPRATPVPRLSNQISIVVQETPTTDRIVGETEFVSANGTSEDNLASTGGAVSPEVVDSAKDEGEAETFSTAHTKTSQLGNIFSSSTTGQSPKTDASVRVDVPISKSDSASAKPADDGAPRPLNSSPRVEILHRASRKRASPPTNDMETEGGKENINRSNKRTKRETEDETITHNNRMSNIDVDEAKKYMAGRKRKSEASEASTDTPSKSQRSSQRSNTAVADSTRYDGPAPRVAVSNSSITKTSQAVKFLKKHGGILIESADEPFNILCVRDGELLKTPKLLLSIARGTPIVTDKWLLNSAKAGQFLATPAYTPSAPKQEKEWNVRFDQVIGQPQTPFSGYTIHFTKSLKATYAAFAEIEHVCKAAGAKKIATTTSRVDKNGKSIVLAKDEGDAEMEKLTQDGITCYHKDLITQSILRGVLNLDSAEFKIQGHAAMPNDNKKTKRQKSK